MPGLREARSGKCVAAGGSRGREPVRGGREGRGQDFPYTVAAGTSSERLAFVDAKNWGDMASAACCPRPLLSETSCNSRTVGGGTGGSRAGSRVGEQAGRVLKTAQAGRRAARSGAGRLP